MIDLRARDSGAIILEGNLDHEMQSEYAIMVQVSDSGMPQLVSTTTVTIAVTDVNDHPPVFNSSTPVVFVEESLPVGSVIFVAAATDADTDANNGAVMFSLLNGSSQFSLSPSGELSLLLPLDREVRSEYVLTTEH